jgi:hypothetical protein
MMFSVAESGIRAQRLGFGWVGRGRAAVFECLVWHCASAAAMLGFLIGNYLRLNLNRSC